MTYQEIKSFINTYIVQNGVNAITGAQLNTALNALADYYGFDAVTVETLPAGTDATVNIEGRTLHLGIPRGVDGIDGQNAVNPFKGWYTTDNIPTEGQAGDYCNVSDTSVTPHTVTIYRWDATQNAFVDTGEVPDTATGETFASSETLQQVAIDDSHLVNPTNTADPTKPVLAKAEDVMQLKAKLEGVTMEETKVSAIDDYKDDGEHSGYFNISSSGFYVEWEANNNYKSTKIAIPQGCNNVRFLGYNRSQSFRPAYVFMDANSNIIGFKAYYDSNVDYVGIMQFSAIIPEQAAFIVCLYHAWGANQYARFFKESDFYFYCTFGKSVSDIIPNVFEQKREQVTQGISTISDKYINSIGQVLSSEGASFKYLPVKKGERYLIFADPQQNGWDISYNVLNGGLTTLDPSQAENLAYIFAGVIHATQSTNSVGAVPAHIERMFRPTVDGYMCYYNNDAASTVRIYRILEEFATEKNYDTYIEEDTVTSSLPLNLLNSNIKAQKVYRYVPNNNYKVIYRTVVGQDYNSIEFLNYRFNVIGSSNDANTVQSGNSIRHIMDDLPIPPSGTVFVRLNFAVGFADSKSGSIGKGMAALMKPLSDKPTLSKNEFSYFVSKVPSTPLKVGDDGSATTQVDSTTVWSAWGAKFPQGHKLAGKKTPLVAYFHGTGGFVTSETLSYTTPYGKNMQDKMLSAGLAVFDINGRGVSFEKDGVDGIARGQLQRHWGCPTAVATAKKAYEVLTEHFNCRKGMAVGGCSMGGDMIESYINTYPNDAVCCFACAPTNLGALARSNSFLNTHLDTAVAWQTDTGDKSVLVGYSKLINITEINQDGSLTANADIDWSAYLDSGNHEFVAPWPVETIIWHGTADTNVDIAQSKVWVKSARNANCNMKLRVCEGYAHEELVAFFDEIVGWVKSKLLI